MHRVLAAVLLAAGLAGIVSCGGASGDAGRPGASVASEPVNGGTVVIGVISDPDNLCDITSSTRSASDAPHVGASRSSSENVSGSIRPRPRVRIAARRISFRSCRTLPGQE